MVGPLHQPSDCVRRVERAAGHVPETERNRSLHFLAATMFSLNSESAAETTGLHLRALHVEARSGG